MSPEGDFSVLENSPYYQSRFRLGQFDAPGMQPLQPAPIDPIEFSEISATLYPRQTSPGLEYLTSQFLFRPSRPLAMPFTVNDLPADITKKLKEMGVTEEHISELENTFKNLSF